MKTYDEFSGHSSTLFSKAIHTGLEVERAVRLIEGSSNVAVVSIYGQRGPALALRRRHVLGRPLFGGQSRAQIAAVFLGRLSASSRSSDSRSE